MKKPNYWLYFSGDIVFGLIAIFAGYFGIKYDLPVMYFLSGAFSVHGSNLIYEYHDRMRDYRHYLREVQE